LVGTLRAVFVEASTRVSLDKLVVREAARRTLIPGIARRMSAPISQWG
jgi:hypothetical protein